MALKYSNYSKRNALVMAMIFICLVAIYNWFITPQTRYLAAAQNYQNTMESRERMSKIISSKLKLHTQQFDKLTQEFELAKQTYFDIADAKSFLTGIQSIAAASGCQVTNLKLSPPRDIDIKDNNSIDICRYQADMTFLGSFPNAVKFLNTIQNQTAKVWIDTISVSMKQAISGYLNCNITLSIYTLKVKENAGHVENKQI